MELRWVTAQRRVAAVVMGLGIRGVIPALDISGRSRIAGQYWSCIHQAPQNRRLDLRIRPQVHVGLGTMAPTFDAYLWQLPTKLEIDRRG